MKNDLFNLEKEIAVVLGGTGVLGGAMAEALASAGARVAVAGRNEQRGRERVRVIESSGGKASTFAI
jgi:NAD(P)-dependent dehydrogenase (short-subunit alcohol dehydrogenase family)